MQIFKDKKAKWYLLTILILFGATLSLLHQYQAKPLYTQALFAPPTQSGPRAECDSFSGDTAYCWRQSFLHGSFVNYLFEGWGGGGQANTPSRQCFETVQKGDVTVTSNRCPQNDPQVEEGKSCELLFSDKVKYKKEYEDCKKDPKKLDEWLTKFLKGEISILHTSEGREFAGNESDLTKVAQSLADGSRKFWYDSNDRAYLVTPSQYSDLAASKARVIKANINGIEVTLVVSNQEYEDISAGKAEIIRQGDSIGVKAKTGDAYRELTKIVNSQDLSNTPNLQTPNASETDKTLKTESKTPDKVSTEGCAWTFGTGTKDYQKCIKNQDSLKKYDAIYQKAKTAQLAALNGIKVTNQDGCAWTFYDEPELYQLCLRTPQLKGDFDNQLRKELALPQSIWTKIGNFFTERLFGNPCQAITSGVSWATGGILSPITAVVGGFACDRAVGPGNAPTPNPTPSPNPMPSSTGNRTTAPTNNNANRNQNSSQNCVLEGTWICFP